MTPTISEIGRRAGVLLLAAMMVSSCTTDRIVYKDREPVSVPAAAAKFVGYSDTTTKQTVCGNCHVDQQTKWKTTLHATAWKDLQASGHASGSCEACHSVGQLGNFAATDGGWTTTKDARYQDVQCESCHGAGLDHVTTPTLANRPLASIATDTGQAAKTGCGECHNGTHHPFVDEWRQSVHGTAPHAQAEYTNTDPTCKGCHSGQGALERFGVSTNYVEKGAATAQPITCVVCHDPHGGNGIDKQLRLSATTPNVDQNLCMKCHQRRAVPDQPNYSRNSPHSPEGETLLGYAGWFPPNMNLPAGSTVVATHGTDRNPKLCAGCHVNNYAVNDAKTGTFVFQVTGHRFEATPCVDANGQPTGKSDCTEAQRAFKGCVASGCHGSESAARSALTTAENRITTLAAQVDALVAKVAASEKVKDDGRYTSAEGAQFNAALARAGNGGGLAAGPAVAHNPFLIEQLLTASIKQLQQDYKLSVSASINLNNILPNSSH